MKIPRFSITICTWLAMVIVAMPLHAEDVPQDHRAAMASIVAEDYEAKLLSRVLEKLQANRFEQAIAEIDRADDKTASLPMVRNARAAALISLERMDEAREILLGLTEENSGFFQADYNLGEIMFLEKDLDGAGAHFRRMRAQYGELPLLRFKLLVISLLAGEETDAEILLRTFRFPSEAPAWYFAHAAAAATSGDLAQARELAKTATKIHGEQSTATFRETLEKSKIIR